LAGAFFAGAFFAGAFLAVAFFATTFLAGAFFAAGFLTAGLLVVLAVLVDLVVTVVAPSGNAAWAWAQFFGGEIAAHATISLCTCEKRLSAHVRMLLPTR